MKKPLSTSPAQSLSAPGGGRLAVIAAGGTGGHMFPAAAFAAALRARGFRILLMTDPRGAVYAKDFPADAQEFVEAATFAGKNPLTLLRAAGKILRGITRAKERLLELRPAVVAGFGGYPSFPALWGARDLRIPILIHEQNAVLGRVNRFFAGDAAIIACGFERLDRLAPRLEARKRLTGNPVREPIIAARAVAYPALPPGGMIRLLAIGGSQGARILGDIIPQAIAALDPDLRRRIEIVHQVRADQQAAAEALYAEAGVRAECAPFFSDIGMRMANAHLVIARAGASSVTEIAAIGRPSILVPLAIAADDHQTANAEALVSARAADVLAEAAFTAPALAALLTDRLNDPGFLLRRAEAARALGRVDAAARLADLAESIATG